MEALKTTSKREAELLRQERIAAYHPDRAKFLREDINPTVEEFEAQYFPWAESHKRPATIETERNFWGQFMAFTRAKRLGDISHQDVERFKANFLITRHTFASWHVMNGTEIALVSRWLGHSKVDITMKHYAGLRP